MAKSPPPSPQMPDRDPSTPPVFFEKIALIGLGLIGSSICHASKRVNIAGHIVGHARSARTRQTALDLGFIDAAAASPEAAASDADLVILCTPVGVCGKLAKQIAAHLKPGAILSDVGSVKQAVISQVAPHVPDGVHFIPGHPIAGTEDSGPQAGFAELFDDRWCILTPLPETDNAAVGRLTQFWQALGSKVETMPPDHHDMVLAITSHLPHLIAFNIVDTARDLEHVHAAEIFKFAAGGFRDFTRIAASDPVMWRDVFLHNRDAVLDMLGRFQEDLSTLSRAIRCGDGKTLEEKFSHTRDIRRGIIAAGQEIDAPDFGRPHGSRSQSGRLSIGNPQAIHPPEKEE